jgi:hypothetical protein
MRKLIYIMGCANCGSTLLTTLLSKNPRIATVGELKATKIGDPKNYLCGCGEPLSQCEFWSAVQKTCKERSLELSFDDFQTHYQSRHGLLNKLISTRVRSRPFELLRQLARRIYPPMKHAIAAITERNYKIIDTICDIQSRDVFLDGSKDPVRLQHLMDSNRFDIWVIHMIRDGRGVVCSYKKKYDSDLSKCISSWKIKTIECIRACRGIPESRLLPVKYEELCENPSVVLSSIFEFLQLQKETVACHSLVTDHIIGNRMRLEAGNCKIVMREEWRTYLTDAEKELFAVEGGGINSKNGYSIHS